MQFFFFYQDSGDKSRSPLRECTFVRGDADGKQFITLRAESARQIPSLLFAFYSRVQPSLLRKPQESDRPFYSVKKPKTKLLRRNNDY